MSTMTPAPSLPSHLRFLMAGIQDRALDLALTGRVSVRVELDIADNYAIFELVTRPGHCDYLDPASRRLTADLQRIVNGQGLDTLEQALDKARAQLGAMLDHLSALEEEGTT